MIMQLTKYIKLLSEDFNEWNTGLWYHYSNEPYLKINPKPYHQDPIGYYFFPQKFIPHSYWLEKKYKFKVKIKGNPNILDIHHITYPQIEEMLRASNSYDEFYATHTRYPQSTDVEKFKMAWDIIRQKFYSRHATFNKFLRSFGYDGMFDDTKSIHVSEVQLILFEPKFVDIVSMQSRSGSGYKEMVYVTNWLTEIGKKYGKVTVEEPKKGKDSWYSTEYRLMSSVQIENITDEKNYAMFRLHTNTEKYPTLIRISLSYSNPRLNYGVGGQYSIIEQKFTNYTESSLISDLEKIFKGE